MLRDIEGFETLGFYASKLLEFSWLSRCWDKRFESVWRYIKWDGRADRTRPRRVTWVKLWRWSVAGVQGPGSRMVDECARFRRVRQPGRIKSMACVAQLGRAARRLATP